MIKQKQEEDKHRREAQEASRQMKELEQKLMVTAGPLLQGLFHCYLHVEQR